MTTTDYKGIDYGLGRTNYDKQTGIRFGVISQNEVCQAWSDNSESQYGDPHCPKCGNEAKHAKGEYARYEHAKHECADYVCHHCKYVFGSESAFPDSPVSFTYERDGYACECGEDGDIFILKSPFFTYAQFCSPCAPGACYLTNPLEEPDENNKAYCFGHDWFEDEKAPYPVYSVETGKEIVPKLHIFECPNCKGTGRDTLARLAQVRQCKPSEISIPELHVSDYRESDQAFTCFRCNGKGTQSETVYEEKD